MTIGTRIKELRKLKGLTQTQWGNKINVTKVSISCYENGTRIPNLETFVDLVNALDTTPDYLLGRDITVVAEEDEKYSIVLPKIELEILKEIKKNPELHKFLTNDPKRAVEYIVKKSI